MQVIKRSGQVTQFDKYKITSAIMRAMKYGSGIVDEEIANSISDEIENILLNSNEAATIYKIEDLVYRLLTEKDHILTAKAYEGYRAIQGFKRTINTTDDSILGLLKSSNKEVMEENSNKNAILASTQRDLVAGEISKDIARRKLLPTHLVQAHDEGVIHMHDLDYIMQPIFNCCLVNIGDMLDNGTVINGKMIESPKSFQVACTVLTQIIAQVSSGQHGGQSISIEHLGKYLRRSRDKFVRLVADTGLTKEQENEIVSKMLQKELEAGVQTIQFQINTLMTTNG